MEAHLGAEIDRQHLRSEADAQKRLAFPQRHGDPVDFAAHEIIRVVGAHRTAKDHATAVLLQGPGQRIAEARFADVKAMAIAHKPLADVAGIGVLLVQDDADGRLACTAVLVRDLTDRTLLRALAGGDVKHWVRSILVVAATIQQWESLVYAA